MIPLKDNIPSSRPCVVTIGIIAANALVFLAQVAAGPNQTGVFYKFGLVPNYYSDLIISNRMSIFDHVYPFFSSMFLHGGFFHLLGNMWILWIFGDNVEDHLGHVRYLLFYIAGGVFAGIFHLFTNYHSQVPVVGASGAVAAVMGAYFILYPRARVLTLIPAFFFFPIVELPAFFFLGIWALLQFMSGTTVFIAGKAAGGGIAWWAHVGGFAAGVAAIKLIWKKPPVGQGRGSTFGRWIH